MQTRLDIETQVSRLLQKTSTTYLAKIDDWIQQRYDYILRRYDWPHTIRSTSVTSVVDSSRLPLPKDCEHPLVIFDTTNDRVLTPLGNNDLARTYVDIINTSGVPTGYTLEGANVSSQPTSASVLTLVSSSSADTTQSVRVSGIVSGQEFEESVTLTGTSNATTTGSYTRVDNISKSAATAGRITVTSNSGAVTIVIFGINEFQVQYLLARLNRPTAAATTYDVTYKIKVPRLDNAVDVPIIPCHNALIIGAYAQGLEEQRQFAKAQVEWVKFEAEVTELINQFGQRAEGVTRFTPHLEPPEVDMPFNA